jgi:hypothetical protein
MVTARRVGRWALYGAGGVLALIILVRVGVGIYLATPAGKSMVARQIASRIGMPVEVQSVRVGLVTSSIGMRVFDPAVSDTAKSQVLAIEDASADVSLFGILRGAFAPDEVSLRGVNLTLHVSADGEVITTLPKTSGDAGSGMATPAINLTGGQITVRQDGRPEFALHNLNLRSETTPDGGAKLSGTIDDPLWSKWTVAGEISGTSSSGWVELATPDGPLTMDRLSSIPFVPPAVWENVRPNGRGALKLRVWKNSGSEVEYSVDITPAAADLTLPPASVTVHKLTGLIRVTGAKVTLVGTKAELAGGTIAVDGDLDFGGDPTTMNLKVSAEGLDIRKLPSEWKLPKDFAGKLKGRAELALKIHDDGRIEPEGGGEGVITDVRVLDFPADDIPIYLRKRGSRYEFEQPKKAIGLRTVSREAVRCAAPRERLHPEGSVLRSAPAAQPGCAAPRERLHPEGVGVLSPGRSPGEATAMTPPPEGVRENVSQAFSLPGAGGRVPRASLRCLEAAPASQSCCLEAAPASQSCLPWAENSQPFGLKAEDLLILATQPQQPKKDEPPKKPEQPKFDYLGPKADDATTLDATIRLRDIEIAELLDRLKVNLGYKITGKITVEAAVVVPVSGAISASSYEFSGSLSSPAITFERFTVRDFTAKMTYTSGKLTLTDFSGSIDQPGGTPGSPGTFRGTATAAVDPPGEASASFAFDRVPLGEVLKAIPNFTVDVRGTVSGKLALKAPYEKLWDTTLWSGSGELTSSELVVEGRAAKDIRMSGEVAKGQLTLKDAGLTLEGIPVTGEGTFGLTDTFAFNATIRTTGTNVTDLRKLVPEIELPAPVEGVLKTETNVTGTISPLAFTATGTVTASKLTLASSTANHVSAKWELTRDKLAVSELKADVFGGTVNASADVPFDRDKAGKFEVAFKELDAAAATELVPDFPVRIAGKVSGKVGGAIPPAKPGEPRVGNLDVDLTAPKLTVQGIPAERLVGKGSIRGKSLEYQLVGRTLGGSFEIKGRYPGRKKVNDGMGMMDDRGSFRLTGLDLSRVATDVGFRSLAPLRGRVDANFEFENDLSAGSGRLTISRLQWGNELIAEELSGVITLQDGLVQLQEVNGRVAGGLLRARGRVFLTDTSRNFFSITISGAEAKQLLAPLGAGELLEGPVTVVVRGRLGSETQASGTLTLPRGTATGVQVSDLRVPFEFATSPGGHGRLTVREAAVNAGSGRVRAELTADWGYTTRIDGRIRFTDVPLRTISPALGEISLLGNGRITGRFDLDSRNMRSLNDLRGTLIATLNNTSVREIPVLAQTTRFLNPTGLVKPFEAGDVRATLSRGVFHVHRLALANPAAQIFAEGTISTAGLVDLDVVAHTGSIGPDVRALRAFGLRLPAIGPIPIGLIRDVSDFLSNRTIRLSITGSTDNPIVRVNVGALLREQAVRFFLSRYVVPADAAAVLGLGASFGSMDERR